MQVCMYPCARANVCSSSVCVRVQVSLAHYFDVPTLVGIGDDGIVSKLKECLADDVPTSSAFGTAVTLKAKALRHSQAPTCLLSLSFSGYVPSGWLALSSAGCVHMQSVHELLSTGTVFALSLTHSFTRSPQFFLFPSFNFHFRLHVIHADDITLSYGCSSSSS